MEVITTEFEGKKYNGTFEIVNAGGGKCYFTVSFEDLYHQDKTLFKRDRREVMKIHAEFVLKKLIKKHFLKLNGE